MGIRDFGSKATEDIYDGKNSKRARTIPVELHDRARRKLDQINRVENLEDLDHPPANRLEALKGDLKGKHSIASISSSASSSSGPPTASTKSRSSTTTSRRLFMIPKNRPPTSPGEMLREEFLAPAGVTQSELAEAMGVSRRTVSEIVNGHRAITSRTAYQLAGAVGMTPGFWLGLQADWDLWHAGRREPELLKIKRIAKLQQAS